MNDYATQVEIPRSRNVLFNALSRELEAWWGKQDQPLSEAGIIFKVSWGTPWYQFRVIEYKEDELMVWECIDANQIIPGLSDVEKEWVGTKIHWQLEKLTPDTTILHFKHEGLIPDFLCFDFCSRTWDQFLKERLISYLQG